MVVDGFGLTLLLWAPRLGADLFVRSSPVVE